MSIISSRQKGFTLLELAIALVVLGILIVMFNGLFRLIFDTDKRIAQINENRLIQGALETYVAVNFRIPCPDVNGDGFEDPPTGIACTAQSGGLPFKELGTKSVDAWGNSYYYRVISTATDVTKTSAICETASFFGRSGTLDDSGLQICSTSNEFSCDALGYCADLVASSGSVSGSWSGASLNGDYSPFGTIYTPLTDELSLVAESGDVEDTGVLAVFLSWGANGGSLNATNCTGGTTNEQENCNDDNAFIKTETGLNRDYVTPITIYQAKKAMITSRRFK